MLAIYPMVWCVVLARWLWLINLGYWSFHGLSINFIVNPQQWCGWTLRGVLWTLFANWPFDAFGLGRRDNIGLDGHINGIAWTLENQRNIPLGKGKVYSYGNAFKTQSHTYTRTSSHPMSIWCAIEISAALWTIYAIAFSKHGNSRAI